MTPPFTVAQLFQALQSRLQLQWGGGADGAERPICPPDQEDTGSTLVGHLNFIHPYRIQVLGGPELEYLAGLDGNAADAALERLCTTGPAAIIISGGLTPPAALLERCERESVPLLLSGIDSNLLVTYLQYFLSQRLAKRATLHGVFMEVMGIGVLLTGESSIGKSELALELITRGHRLVADDAPEFSRVLPDVVNGSCPEMLRDFLEVRGLGVINVRAMFGDSAIKPAKYLRLIVRLEAMDDERLRDIDRLQGARTTRKVLGVEVPEVALPVAPGRNLAVLVETAVRNHIMSMKGYDPCRDFLERHRGILDRDRP